MSIVALLLLGDCLIIRRPSAEFECRQRYLISRMKINCDIIGNACRAIADSRLYCGENFPESPYSVDIVKLFQIITS